MLTTMTTCALSRIVILLAVLLCAASASVRAKTTPAALDCLGTGSNIQGMRDNLETALAYLRKAKDNFGPGRANAITATRQAISEFERLYGTSGLATTPGSEVTQFLGRHGHPRMQWALSILRTLRNEVNSPPCMKNGELDALRQDIAAAIEGIMQAFVFNPPFSGQ